MQIPFFKILQVNLFAFLNQRVDNIDLPAFGNLLVHGLIQAYPTAIKLMKSDETFCRRDFLTLKQLIILGFFFLFLFCRSFC